VWPARTIIVTAHRGLLDGMMAVFDYGRRVIDIMQEAVAR
jgi:hypothetical protein